MSVKGSSSGSRGRNAGRSSSPSRASGGAAQSTTAGSQSRRGRNAGRGGSSAATNNSEPSTGSSARRNGRNRVRTGSEPSDSTNLSTEASETKSEDRNGVSDLISGVMDWGSDVADTVSGAANGVIDALGGVEKAGGDSEETKQPEAAADGTETAEQAQAAETAEAAAQAEAAEQPEAAEPAEAPLELAEGQMLSQGRGSSPEQVRQLQEMLNSRGANLEVDGRFGPLTEQAVRNFQRESEIQVDGIVGPQTMGALNGSSPNNGSGATDGAAPVDGSAPVDGAAPVDGQNPADGTAPVDGENPVDGTPGATSGARLEGLPPRAEDALTGSQFLDEINNMEPGPAREQRILEEILSGNIPEAHRNLQQVDVSREINGQEYDLSYNVMPDYLSIGSDEDNVRIPMTPGTAQAIAERTGTSLPTEMIVDDVQGVADATGRNLHLAPFPHDGTRRADQFMRSTEAYRQHDARIESQLGTGAAQEQIVSGHRKDIVIPARDGRVAIYGAEYSNGNRVQPYSNVHRDYYEDYSHGARLVGQQIMINGQPTTLEAAMADPTLRDLFTTR